MILSDGPEIDNEQLDIDLELVDINQMRSKQKAADKPRSEPAQHKPPKSPNLDPAEDLSLEDYFQRFVLEHQDSMSETELAQKLGVSRKCLWERRQRLGIPRKKSSKTA